MIAVGPSLTHALDEQFPGAHLLTNARRSARAVRRSFRPVRTRHSAVRTDSVNFSNPRFSFVIEGDFRKLTSCSLCFGRLTPPLFGFVNQRCVAA